MFISKFNIGAFAEAEFFIEIVKEISSYFAGDKGHSGVGGVFQYLGHSLDAAVFV